MDLRYARAIQRLSSGPAVAPESRPSTTRHINLAMKRAGKPTAGNPHGGFEAAGIGNGLTVRLVRHSQRKRGANKIGRTYGAARQSSTLPTDSTLLGDGVRVLTRIMKKVTAVAGKAGTQMRDRSRSAKLKVLAIARASRNKTEQGRQKMKNAYVKLVDVTSRVVGQAKKFAREIAGGIKQGNLSVLHKAQKQLDEMIPRVQQVLRQTRERVLRGNTQAEGKLLSIFETHTEVIRKGKANKPNEFGKLIVIQEAENQIVTHYRVCDQRPADSTLLEGCLEQHVEQFGHAPHSVAADPGFFSAANESKAEQMGVSRVSIPSHDTKSPARKQRQKQRWFKKLQKWRTGCEGRISVLKRRHGLRRSLYRGPDGIRRWVGLGVIADNVIHIGTHLAEQARSR
jgi:transposase, IS5 family